MQDFPIAEVGVTLGIVLTFLGWMTKQMLTERKETKKIAREFTDHLKEESAKMSAVVVANTESNKIMIEALKELTKEVRNGHDRH